MRFALYTALLLALGCASAPPPDRGPVTPRPPSNTPGEDFDPQSLQEDLLLIQPTFAPPTTDLPTPPPVDPPQPDLPDETGTAVRTEFRVQIQALSNRSIAFRNAVELAQQFDDPVYLVEDDDFFAVRIGSFPTYEAAEELRKELVAFLPQYPDSYVTDRHQPAHATVLVDPGDSVWNPNPDMLPSSGDGEPVKGPGWRVLLEQFNEFEQAEDFRRQAIERLGRQDIDTTFQTPYYKVLLGHFPLAQEQDAQEMVNRIRRRYPNALKVRGQINLPQEQQ